MLLRTSGASRLYIAKLAASATASARANRTTFFHSCGHHGVRRNRLRRIRTVGTAMSTAMLARKVQPSRSRTSRASVCIVLASIAVSITTP
jgi:hypothetical protein